MKLLFSMMALAGLGATGGVQVRTPNPIENPNALLALRIIEASAASSCGFEISCLSAEHRIDDTGPFGEWLGAHDCTGPANHSGPECQMALSIEDVREMTHGDVVAYVRGNSDANVRINDRWDAVDVLDCTGSVIVGRVPFSGLRTTD